MTLTPWLPCWRGRGPAVASEVRRALPADAESLLPLIREHAAFERSVATCTAEALRAAVSGDLPRLLAWLAEQDSEPVGYAAATVDFSTWSGQPYLHLDCLFVGPHHRGLGIGAELLRMVRSYAASHGITELQWQTPDWNEDARRFYVREGASAARKMRFHLPQAPARSGNAT